MALKQEMLEASLIEAICKTIADTSDGLTGTEIGKILSDCKIQDSDPSLTKWKRLYNAFANYQHKNNSSEHILIFLQEVFRPVRYIGREEVFQRRRNDVNKRLSFIGYEITDRGTLARVMATNTIAEAEQRASHFKYKLETRNIHNQVLQYCTPELLSENYFHSVFEATKSVADRLRAMTGLYADGTALVEVALSTTNPLIRINLLQNDTQRSEHIGLLNLIKGLFGLIRNPTAHEPKIKFPIGEQDALDMMTMISFVHYKLDSAL